MLVKSKISGSINVGSAWSQPIFTNDYVVTGLVLTGSVVTGSQVSFLVSSDGINYIPLFSNTGTEVLLAVTGSPRAFSLNNDNFKSWSMLKLRLGYSGSSVNQATYPLYFDIITTSD